MTFLVTAARSNGAITAVETTATIGEGPPLHVHRGEDELIYVLDGRFQIKLDGELLDAPAGSCVFVPRGTSHTWQALGDPTSRMLAAVLPAAVGFEQLFVRYAALAPAERGPAAFHRLARETRALEVVGPSLAVSDPP
jgi:quercetin dioxygenase-like cupin family protein